MNHLSPKRSRAVIATAALGALLVPSVVHAKITPYPRQFSAAPIADAIARNPDRVRDGVFAILPPKAKPAAVSTTKLADFPRRGNSYAILSTGNATLAARPNNSPDTGSNSTGPKVRGARDVLMVRIGVFVPPKHNCLSFSFRFLSEEYPEFVDDIFNDTFVAELDKSNWRSQRDEPTVKAPRNFAVDGQGNPIRVNQVGDTTMSAEEAAGTTYDGATRLLRASAAITPGRHQVFLSIFDQGDRKYDSAVFIDNLGTSRANSCQEGVRLES